MYIFAVGPKFYTILGRTLSNDFFLLFNFIEFSRSSLINIKNHEKVVTYNFGVNSIYIRCVWQKMINENISCHLHDVENKITKG